MTSPQSVFAPVLPLLMSEQVVPAGFPSPCEDHTIKRIDLNEVLLLRPDASFMFRVKGDSMTDAGIFDGDTLIVDRSITPAHNHIVVAIVDGDFTVKRLYMRAGRIRLMPANANFYPIDFKDGQELRVFGVATHNVHHLATGPWQRD